MYIDTRQTERRADRRIRPEDELLSHRYTMDAVKNAAHAQLAQLRAKIDDNELLHSLEVSSATTIQR